MAPLPTTRDPLTGLANRVLLDDRLGGAISRAARSSRPLTVMRLDLDDFAAINAEHGRQIGDRVLHEVGVRIRRVIRGEDTAARVGGDEFVIVAEGLDAAPAEKVAARIAETIAEPMNFDGLRTTVAATIAVVCVEAFAPLDRAGLLLRSEQVLRRARLDGAALLIDGPSHIDHRRSRTA